MNDDLIRRGKMRNDIALCMAENAYLSDTALDVLKMIAKWVDAQPAVDAVEVVRCKDCESATHCEEEGEPVRLVCPMWGANCDENEFCSRGERREEGDKTMGNSEKVAMLPVTGNELKYLINDTIAYIWKLEDTNQAIPDRGYDSRKELLQKLKQFDKENFPELECACG